MVFLATPNNLHSRQTIAAAQAGKHLLIEKPAALDVDSLERSIAAVERAGITSLVGFVLHWNPMFDMIKSQLRADLLGRVFYAEVNYWHQVGDWYSDSPGPGPGPAAETPCCARAATRSTPCATLRVPR